MTATPKRRWFRFSMRSLLILVVVLAVPIAWVANERKQSADEMQIAAKLQEQGMAITFAGPYDDFFSLVRASHNGGGVT